MIPAIVTLVIGLAIVIASFFLSDGKKEDETEGALADSREKLEKQLDEYCDLLVEKKKNDLKKQGDEVKNDMKKGLDDVKNSSKKELEEIKAASRKELDEYRESTKKDIDDFRNLTDKSVYDMTTEAAQKIDKAMEDYKTNLAAAKDRMKIELEACSSQLSEKAKKQMIDYINQSLTEAYEAYDPEDTSEKEPITYEEEYVAVPETETVGTAKTSDTTETTDMSETTDISEISEISESAEPADTAEPAEPAETTDISEPSEPAESTDTTEPTESVEIAELAETEDIEYAAETGKTEEKENSEELVQSGEPQEIVVAIEEHQVTDSAFTVVEAENPEKMAADIEDGSVVPVPQRNRNNRSKKKKKRKASQNKPLDIWDEGVDTETQVAELHKKGLSIMEIANKLGIGVGEAKIMIDKINETKKTNETDGQ